METVVEILRSTYCKGKGTVCTCIVVGRTGGEEEDAKGGMGERGGRGNEPQVINDGGGIDESRRLPLEDTHS